MISAGVVLRGGVEEDPVVLAPFGGKRPSTSFHPQKRTTKQDGNNVSEAEEEQPREEEEFAQRMYVD